MKGDPCDVHGCSRITRYGVLCETHKEYRRLGQELTPIREWTNPTFRDGAGRKRCRSCLEFLDPGHFTARTSEKDGLHRYCRPCQKYKLLWTQYRLSQDEVNRRLEEQGHGCAICETPIAFQGDNLFTVDHDHACCDSHKSCGECVRALLCHLCNQALGSMRDDPSRLRAAAEYLERWAARLRQSQRERR